MQDETPRQGTFGIGTLSERTGCPIETIRYYERSGLLRPPPRSMGGQRQYGEADVQRLSFIRRARALDFALTDVRHLMQLADRADAPRAEALAIAHAHLARVQGQLTELAQKRQALEAMVAGCPGGGPDCPILAALIGGAQAQAVVQ